MGRPRSIDSATANTVEAVRQSLPAGATVGTLHAAIAARGVKVSAATLRRHLARSEPAPVVAAAVPADGDDRFTPAALAADLRQHYVEAQALAQSLRSKAKAGGPAVPRWLRTIEAVGSIAERLAAVAPKPPVSPDDDPANLEGHRALLERADEFLRRAGTPIPERHRELVGLK